jgi:hypothetical protein
VWLLLVQPGCTLAGGCLLRVVCQLWWQMYLLLLLLLLLLAIIPSRY